MNVAERAKRVLQVARTLDDWRRDLTERRSAPTAEGASALLDALNKSGTTSLYSDARDLLLEAAYGKDAR